MSQLDQASAGVVTLPQPGDPVIIDVWSRTAPKYRRRAVLMLTALVILFAGLCCFTYWLRTGNIWPGPLDAYRNLMMRSINPSGATQITLSSFLSAPISVREVPIHSVIMGLLLATLSSIPILVVILYRFPSAVIFAVMVGVVAAMPWLGLTILLGCGLASIKPFRFTFRYASAMLGLIPVGIYFVTASWEPRGSAVKHIEHEALLYAPWVLAILSSCVICALALAVARLINYRPGGITPILAIFFAVPVILFYWQVGRDELDYRILENEIQTGSSAMFSTVDIAAEAHRQTVKQWSKSSKDSFDKLLEHRIARLKAQAILLSETNRAVAAARCDQFIEHFPASRYVPNVLFLKGQALDQRLNFDILETQKRAEYRCDIPCLASMSTWQTIEERFPGDDLASVALLKLAILRARDGALDSAIELLDRLSYRFGVAPASSQPVKPSTRERITLFQRSHPSERLGVDQAVVTLQGRRLRELLASCRDDSSRPADEIFHLQGNKSPVHPAQLLMRLDSADPHYEENLRGILQAFPASTSAGFTQVRLTMLEKSLTRSIEEFRELAVTLEGRAAGAEALFLLGDRLEKAAMLPDVRQAFEKLILTYPASCWADEARQRLLCLTMIEEIHG
jgi:TolA-binding protein